MWYVDPTGEYYIYVWEVVRVLASGYRVYGWVKKWVEPELDCSGLYCKEEGGRFGGAGASGSFACESDGCEERKAILLKACLVDERQDVVTCYNRTKDMCK